MRLMRKMGFAEYQDGDLRLVMGAPQGTEPAPITVTQQERRPAAPDPENAADLVLFPPTITADDN
jgi:hypothetical protein